MLTHDFFADVADFSRFKMLPSKPKKSNTDRETYREDMHGYLRQSNHEVTFFIPFLSSELRKGRISLRTYQCIHINAFTYNRTLLR